MKIKEVEQRVGITRANIRYYEEEGLISPARNSENNYRDYSEEDVNRLERIKVLRMLSVPISDIKYLIEGEMQLNEVMEKRLLKLEEEKKDIADIERVCKDIRQRDISFESVDESILGEDGESYVWMERLERIMREDIVKERLTRSQLNTNLAIMLAWGYALNVLISFFFGDWILQYEGVHLPALENVPYLKAYGDGVEIFNISSSYLLIISIIISIICYIAMYFSANVKVHLVIFHISALVLTPVVAGAYMLVKDFILASFVATQTGEWGKVDNTSFSGGILTVFWLMALFYVVALWIISHAWNKFWEKARNVVLFSIVFAGVFTVLEGSILGYWLVPGIAAFAYTLYIGLNWFHTYWDGGENPNRYYVVVNGSRIMNLAGVAFNMKGKTVGPLVFR